MLDFSLEAMQEKKKTKRNEIFKMLKEKNPPN